LNTALKKTEHKAGGTTGNSQKADSISVTHEDIAPKATFQHGFVFEESWKSLLTSIFTNDLHVVSIVVPSFLE